VVTQAAQIGGSAVGRRGVADAARMQCAPTYVDPEIRFSDSLGFSEWLVQRWGKVPAG
jgi:hypothetical protein